ncbi:PKD domain-containing protein [Candidatus Peregrinibacteria bacterium]|nr:PKD domain-containing protein [Candidatus Peregrinibacteria bacterium]
MDTNQSSDNNQEKKVQDQSNSVADFGTGNVDNTSKPKNDVVIESVQNNEAKKAEQSANQPTSPKQGEAPQEDAVPNPTPTQPVGGDSESTDASASTSTPQQPAQSVQPQQAGSQQSAPAQAVQPKQQQSQQQPQQTQKPKKRKMTPEEIVQRDKARNKKMILGCGGAFGFAALVLIILIFVFVGQGASGTSALAQSLGIDQQSLVNTLILIVNIFFGIGAFVTFIMSIGGIFKAVMARKDDAATKKKGYVMAGGSFGALIIIIMMWIGAWIFLSGQQVPTTTKPTGLVTEPESTVNLVAPVEITFDASDLPYDSSQYEIISYVWDFDDGQAGPGSSLETHRYEKKGDGRYDVTLTLTFLDKDTGEESTETLTKLVTIADEKVAAVIEADVTSGDAPLEVTFDGSQSADPDGEISTYAWQVDGNGFEEGESTYTHTFDQVGVYTVELRVTNPKGDFDVAEEQITVSAGKTPVAQIDVLNGDGGVFYVNKTYTFDASGSSSPVGNIVSYEWDFGDGTAKARSRTAQHDFTEEGTYKVLLTVTDEDDLTAEEELQVEVELAPSAPEAVMQTDPEPEDDATSIAGSVPFEVNFNATSSTDPDDDIIDYKWDFDGDGTFDAAGENTSYVYNDVGNYNASLTVIDSAGFEDKEVLLIKALSRGLEPQLTAEPVSGVVPLTVSFDATGSMYSDGDIVSYEWNFGDGSAPRSDIGQVTYKYTKIGNFTTTVKVRTDDGKQEEATILISVRQVPLKSCFEASKTVGEAPLTVSLNPQCSTGTISKYKWDFGDGESSTDRKPIHIYDEPGSYEITLEVSDAQNIVDVSSEFVTVKGALTN